ncbi:hypothetical protein HG535_0E00590 [Zygotorulaspora mrakii]|uniref:Protein kinase domain-containing protein n=1 Tax=Zygotorulaspora mrakii TaxID=42260 RepID=A0A7H9B2T4_ZYGMR|nr:uncharacterized protein HG535_0E00590 [Zygotorulaspora mrakii]QLG72975.1 hypothetical protein HG535_0E00590 [Zygotorulaspora mrakii]
MISVGGPNLGSSVIGAFGTQAGHASGSAPAAGEYLPWPNLDREHATAKCKYVTRRHMLGDGHFSVVKECMNVHTRDLFAMKLVHKNMVKGKLQLIQREVKLLRVITDKVRSLEKRNYSSLDVFEGHHHVLQLFDFFETSESIALITQLCDKGDLYEKIINEKTLDLQLQVKPYCACLLSVLEFLHSNNIVHRDLKAENVLFRLRVNNNEPNEHHGNFKYDDRSHDLILADFGLAAQVDVKSNTNALKEYVGTISYIAPEIVLCRGIGDMSREKMDRIPKYGCPVDVWALGVLTYFMACGYTPFDCETDEETLECISKVDYYIDEEMQADPKMADFWSFVQSCFIGDAEKRPKAEMLKHHPFVRDFFATSAPEEKRDIFPTMLRRTGSTSSLHSLKQPSRSSSSSTIALLSLKNSASPSLVYPANIAETPKRLDTRVNSRERNLQQVRETLRKTLSMTSLKNEGSHSSTIGSKLNSTFILEPKPPVNSLMNGCFSTTPESKSNFGTPGSLSRQSSENSILLSTDTSMTSHENLNEKLHSYQQSRKIDSYVGSKENRLNNRHDGARVDDNGDGDDDDDDDDDDDMGIVI